MRALPARIVQHTVKAPENGGMPPAVDGERVHLRNHLSAFEQAFSEARLLGRAMLERFADMDAARTQLESQGISLGVEFPPEIQASLLRHRELLREPWNPPEWLR